MKARDLKPLEQVAAALYCAEERKVRALLDEEARLRGAIARIDAALMPPAPDAESQARSEVDPAQRSGADMIWRMQIRKQKGALNTELARVLAAKSGRLAQLRQAFGRREAVRLTLDRIK